MKRLLVTTLISALFLFLSGRSVFAQTPNNRFGIHVIDENDFSAAADLVNSNGGQWGYVTFVIREDERDINRWNQAFQKLKELKLIPIVRLATISQNGIWAKPTVSEAASWAKFLNSLDWPTQNHYVILFNEPNHAKEWGGSVNPQQYALLARKYWEQFKRLSPNFFILPAALDLSAPDSSLTLRPEQFFHQMHLADNLIFTIFDGWNSHSYPNPAFCGSPSDHGKTSIRGFEWELEYLQQYDLFPEIPVFITETGWGCSEATEANYLDAFNHAWSNPRLQAVTPFVLNYTEGPFSNFSWINPQTKEPTPQYLAIKNLPKTKGEPTIKAQPNTEYLPPLSYFLTTHKTHSQFFADATLPSL